VVSDFWNPIHMRLALVHQAKSWITNL